VVEGGGGGGGRESVWARGRARARCRCRALSRLAGTKRVVRIPRQACVALLVDEKKELDGHPGGPLGKSDAQERATTTGTTGDTGPVVEGAKGGGTRGWERRDPVDSDSFFDSELRTRGWRLWPSRASSKVAAPPRGAAKWTNAGAGSWSRRPLPPAGKNGALPARRSRGVQHRSRVGWHRGPRGRLDEPGPEPGHVRTLWVWGEA